MVKKKLGLREHCRIDAAVLQKLTDAIDFAPLHMPATLSLITYAQLHFPGVLQVACFDTAFHANLPEIARVFSLLTLSLRVTPSSS